MKTRKVVPLLTTIALLACANATAETVVQVVGEGIATSITDLTIGSNTYDVTFSCLEATDVTYGEVPDFDFVNSEAAYNGVVAIAGAFNASQNVLGVGCGDGRNDFSSYEFIVGFDLDEDVRIPFDVLDIYVDFLQTQNAITGDAASPGVWATVSTGPEDFDRMPYGESAIVARFTLVSGDGSGNAPPVADAGGPNYVGGTGVPVVFNGSGSTDVDGEIVSYQWNFGDEQTGSGEIASHTYSSASDFHVTLTVIDDRGARDSALAYARIGDGSIPPVADAGGPYNGSTSGFPVQFNGLGSFDVDGAIASYFWEFGDGNQGVGPAPQHYYLAPGPYTVTLTVASNDSQTATDTAEVTIADGNIVPWADAGTVYYGKVGSLVSFDGSGSFDLDGEIVLYQWDFGDGTLTSSGEETTSHIYDTAGSYTALVGVTDNENSYSSDTATVLIFESDTVFFEKDIIGLPDVNGNSSADVAVLYTALDLTQTVQILDGSSGAAINTITYGTDPVLAIGAVERDGLPPAVAAMRYIKSTGATQVRISEAATGMLVNDLFLGPDYRGVDMAILPDSDGNGADEVVTYRIDAAQKAELTVQDAVSKAVLATYNHGAGAEPLEVAVMPDLNDDGTGEIALLQRVRSDGKIRVRVLDPETITIINDVSYGNVFSAIAMAIVPGPTPGDTGVGVLGVRASDVVARLLIKNALANTNISTKQWSATEYVPIDLDTVSDNDDDGYADVAMFEETGAGDARVRIFTSETGDQLINFPLQELSGAIAAAAVDDVNGNGASEVAGLGRGGTQFKVHTKDSADKTLVFSTEVP